MGRGRVRSDRRGASGQGSRTFLSAREGTKGKTGNGTDAARTRTGGAGRTMREFRSCFDLTPMTVSRAVLVGTTGWVSGSDVVARERLLMALGGESDVEVDAAGESLPG